MNASAEIEFHGVVAMTYEQFTIPPAMVSGLTAPLLHPEFSKPFNWQDILGIVGWSFFSHTLIEPSKANLRKALDLSGLPGQTPFRHLKHGVVLPEFLQAVPRKSGKDKILIMLGAFETSILLPHLTRLTVVYLDELPETGHESFRFPPFEELFRGEIRQLQAPDEVKPGTPKYTKYVYTK